MDIKIESGNDISKLLAFIRAAAGGKFAIDPTLMSEVIEALRQFAKANNLRVEIVSPSDERMAIFTGGGVMAGAGLGFMLAKFPGAIVGAMVGGAMGYSLAHVRVRMYPPLAGSADPVVVELV